MSKEDLELLKYFLNSKRVTIGYMSKKTGVPYGTIGFYVADVNRIDKANKFIVQALYSFMKELGINNKSDVDKIQRKVEYIVNN